MINNGQFDEIPGFPSFDRNSYIYDPDHVWEIDPICLNEKKTLVELLQEVEDRDWQGLRIILAGYAGLKAHLPMARDEDLLSTSICWYFG
jgi:hypothetical protein